MLKLAGETDMIVGLEKIEQIGYTPGLKNTGDLEVGTKLITTPNFLTTADYSASLSLSSPGDVRLVIKRLCARLQVTRDSGSSASLYCKVTVDSPDGSTNYLFEQVNVQAANLQVTDLTSGTVFDLLKDGSAHTLYFFFRIDSGDSVISLVQLWYTVGSSTTGLAQDTLELTHQGFISVVGYITRLGSGSSNLQIIPLEETYNYFYSVAGAAFFNLLTCLIRNVDFRMKGTVSTDINYVQNIRIFLRSEQ